MKLVFMYSGQGSQYYNMALELYNENHRFKFWMNYLNKRIESRVNLSIIKYIFDSKKNYSDPLDELIYSHFGIFMVEYSLSRTIMDEGVFPDYVIGTSLGEFTALIISGVIDLEEGLDMLVQQVKIIKEHCIEGRMLTIISNASLYDEDIIKRNCEIVSVNYDKHFVVSGDIEGIEEIKKYLDKKFVTYYELPVKYAFHSHMLDGVKDYLKSRATLKKINKPKIRYISGVTAKEKTSFDLEYIWHVARQKIEFADSIKNMEKNGEYIYVDLGPGGTLFNFAKRNISKYSNSEVYQIVTPYGKDITNYNEVIVRLKSNNNLNNKELINMKAYAFPGQGSQYVGMGEELFDEFQEYISKADNILGYSIKDLCLEDKNNNLGKTQYTQPALYIVNALQYLKKVKEEGYPDYVLGHSLGEYSALFASGVFDFETGLKIVKKRGQLMSQMKKGKMAAIIGIDKEEIGKILEDNNIFDIDLANLNTHDQTVIAGPEETIINLERVFEDKARYVILNVSGAFHSRYMEEASEEFNKYLSLFEFSAPKIPVISNVTARPHEFSNIKEMLVKQMYSSVNWVDSIRYLMGQNVLDILQVGPGRSTQGLVDKILLNAEPLIDQSTKEQKDTLCEINEFSLGNEQFKKKYNLDYSYVAGGMYRGVSSKEMVVKLANIKALGFLGTGGMKIDDIISSIMYIKDHTNGSFGLNITHNLSKRSNEKEIFNLLYEYNINIIEVSAFLSPTDELVKYRLKGLCKNNGKIISRNKIIVKLSRPEICEIFVSPAPVKIIDRLLDLGEITEEEAFLGRKIPLAEDICIEADSGGHTDGASPYSLVPTIIRQVKQANKDFNYENEINVGVAGGIGTPESALASFVLGADFIMTGSINECTVEAAISDEVKDLLQDINVQDTEYAPASDMFEIGSKVQVLKRGVLFPARANKLYDLYRNFPSLESIDKKTLDQIEDKYFGESLESVFNHIKSYYSEEEIIRAEENPKVKMAMIFKYYCYISSKWALQGEVKNKVNFQIYCSPALGAFNKWIGETELAQWKNRHVDEIAIMLMKETAILFNERCKLFV